MTAVQRRPDIDNLRSAATLLLLVFHTAKVYDDAPFYHVKNDASFQGIDVFTGFVHQWHMPVFFVLAGWSMAAALSRRDAEQVRAERVRRLLIPLVAFALTACVGIGWIEARHAGDRTVAGNGSPVQVIGVAVTWSHLWFLAYLLTFSLLYLRHFSRMHARTTDFVVERRTLVRFVLVMAGIQVSLRWAWPGQQTLIWDWANFAYYSAFFIAGFYICRFPSIDRLVDDHRAVMTRLGLLASAAMVPFWLRVVIVDDTGDWASYLAYHALSAVAGVGVVIGILGWARRHLDGNGCLHRWARDRSFGIYLLHQGCVVGAAAHIAGTTWPIAAKFAATLALATAATVALNEVARHIGWLAPAFGRDREPLTARAATG